MGRRLQVALRRLPRDARTAIVLDADTTALDAQVDARRADPTDRSTLETLRQPALPSADLVGAECHGRVWWLGTHDLLTDAAPEFALDREEAGRYAPPIARWLERGVRIRRLLWNPYVPGQTPGDLAGPTHGTPRDGTTAPRRVGRV